MGSLLSTSQPNPEWKSDAQFAMESNWFCVICGSPFDLEGEVYNLDSKAARYMVHPTTPALHRYWLIARSGCISIAYFVAFEMSIFTLLKAFQKKSFSVYLDLCIFVRSNKLESSSCTNTSHCDDIFLSQHIGVSPMTTSFISTKMSQTESLRTL